MMHKLKANAMHIQVSSKAFLNPESLTAKFKLVHLLVMIQLKPTMGQDQ